MAKTDAPEVAPDPAPPATIPTAERLSNLLQPYRDLIAWVDAMGDMGSVEQAAREAESRVAAAQRDLDATMAQIEAEKTALAEATAELEQAKSEADAYAAKA